MLSMKYWLHFCLLLLILSSILEKVSTACSSPIINDLQLDYQDCSVIVKWNPPDRECSVNSYVVQFTQGCSSEWRNSTASGNEMNHVISDPSFFAACQINDCYIRIIAEFRLSKQLQANPKQCTGMGDFALLPTLQQKTVVNMSTHSSREVCIPVKSTCALRVSPSFVINGTFISWPPVGHPDYSIQVDDEMQFSFCFNHLTESVVVSEICHINSNCSACSSQNGVVLFKSRTEIRLNYHNAIEDDRKVSVTEEETQIICNGTYPQFPKVAKFCNKTHLLVEGSSKICVCFDLSLTLSNVQNFGLLDFSVNMNNVTTTGFTFRPNSSVEFKFEDLLQTGNTECVEVTSTTIMHVDTSKVYQICFEMQIMGHSSVVDIPEQCANLQVVGFNDPRHNILESSILISIIISIVVLSIIIVIFSLLYCRFKHKYTVKHSDYSDINKS